MIKRYRVLIADKNSRIRRFLKREFTLAGYAVRLADSSDALLKLIYGPSRLDLLILDPDLPDVDADFLSRKLQDRVPPLPVVLHTLAPDEASPRFSLTPAEFVEKRGNSVEDLKKTVSKILRPLEDNPQAMHKKE